METSPPPATIRELPTDPSSATVPTHSSVPSQGRWGWFQASQQSRVPSGDRRGSE